MQRNCWRVNDFLVRRYGSIICSILLLIKCISLPAQADILKHGHLIIVGGGSMSDSLFHIFGSLAGGKEKSLVIIPTAMSDEGIVENAFKNRFIKLGFKDIQVVHTRDKSKADTPENIAKIQNASAIYFSGGDQSRIADAFLGTQVHKELKILLDRGGVIMGTSAGATIMGSILIGGDSRSYPNIHIPYPPALDLLPGIVLDQHVLKRNRQFDLIPVLENYPHYLGIAIDEQTAIIVSNNQFKVWGLSYVLIYNTRDWELQKEKYGRILKPFRMLSKGQNYDLVNRRILK